MRVETAGVWENPDSRVANLIGLWSQDSLRRAKRDPKRRHSEDRQKPWRCLQDLSTQGSCTTNKLLDRELVGRGCGS